MGLPGRFSSRYTLPPTIASQIAPWSSLGLVSPPWATTGVHERSERRKIVVSRNISHFLEGRVRGRGRPHPLPSEPYRHLSTHTAQALDNALVTARGCPHWP